MKRVAFLLSSLAFLGCANIDFDSKDKGLTYYEPMPYLFISVTDKCISTATVVSIPGPKKKMELHAGFGSSELSAEFSNGIITKIGQASDSKIPETLTSVAALQTAGILAAGGAAQCKPTALLFPIKDGVPDTHAPINISLGQQ
jgi:hypothetical protein